MASRFFDDYAEENSDDDDEDDGDFREAGEVITTEIEQEAIDRQKAGRQKMAELFGGSAEEVARRFEEQYEDVREQEELYKQVGEFFKHDTQVAQQSLLPSAKDPKIFMIKCTPGKEMELTRSVMNKTLAIYEKTKMLKVKSAFCGSAKGYIFIEALSDSLVKEIIMGLKGLYMGKIRQLAVDQMTSALRVKVLKKPLTVHQFVRIKRGPLKGDLVRIVSLKEGDTKAEIQAVPRIYYDESTANDEDGKKGSKGMKLNAGQKVRPPAALFDPERAFGEDMAKEASAYGFYQWRGDTYKGGFLIKTVDVNMYIDSVDVQPRLEELRTFSLAQDFNHNDPDPEAARHLQAMEVSFNEQLTKQIRSLEGVDAVPYVPGDLVQVVKGETAGLIGRVLLVDEMRKLLRVQPLNTELKGAIEVEQRLVTKYIEAGAHVKVMGGRYEGQTGRVVAVMTSEADPMAVILTDGVNTEIHCSVSLLQNSVDVAAGYGSLKGYELYDLVQLNENEVGVIINIGVEALRVLTQMELIKDVDPNEVRAKLTQQSLRMKAFEMEQKQFSVGDTLRVAVGTHEKLSGTVRHINKGYAWLHSTSYMKNSGIFVVRPRNCVLAGSINKDTKGPATSAPPNAGGRQSSASTPNSAYSRNSNGAGGAANNRTGRDPLVGKTVRITHGAHKGMLAQVVDGNGGFYSMELLAKLKKVTVSRAHIVEEGDRHGRINDQNTVGTGSVSAAGGYGSAYGDSNTFVPPTPHIGFATPMHALGSETPRFTLGNETPFVGMQTPRRGDEVSDAWRVGDDDIEGDGGRSVMGDTSVMNTPSLMSDIGTPHQYGAPAPPVSSASAATVTNADPSTWVVNMIVLVKSGSLMGRLAVLLSLPDSQGNCVIQQRDGMGRLTHDKLTVPVSSIAPTDRLPSNCKVLVLAGKYKGSTGVVQVFTWHVLMDPFTLFINFYVYSCFLDFRDN